MARPAQFTSSDLTQRLQVSGAVTAQGLAEQLQVNRSTVSRGLAWLGEAVVVLGAARRARHALPWPVRSAGDRWPVSRVDAAGRASEWARLHALPGGVWVEWAREAPAGGGDVAVAGRSAVVGRRRFVGFSSGRRTRLAGRSGDRRGAAAACRRRCAGCAREVWPVDTPVKRRWANLLAVEAHALTVLAEHGLATAGARVDRMRGLFA